jgi:transcriptional regulator with XRE-family HTH domain
MWHRTKRLINSYLDDLIHRVSSPDREARGITRAEVARLHELEVQTRASAKMLEKELAEVGLKILGVAERERLFRERGDEAAASAAGSQLVALSAQRDLIMQQLGEAKAAAERARALREERRLQGEDLAAETHLTAMRENLSSIQSPFDKTDPSATIEEMRERLRRSGASLTDNRVEEADRELEAARARAQVEDALSRYKQGVTGDHPLTPTQGAPPAAQTATPSTDAGESSPDDNTPGQSKTLGRTDGPIRPID